MTGKRSLPSPTAIWTGSSFLDLADPSPDAIHLADIARNLARVHRFCGQVPYTVAEHSVAVARLADEWVRTVHGLATGAATMRAALMHDAAEAYIGDLPTPARRILPDFNALHERLMGAVRDRFALGRFDRGRVARAVDAADIAAAASEKVYFMPGAPSFDFEAEAVGERGLARARDPERQFLAVAADLGLA